MHLISHRIELGRARLSTFKYILRILPEYNYNKKQHQVYLCGVIAESCVGPLIPSLIPCSFREEFHSLATFLPTIPRSSSTKIRMKPGSGRL